MNKDNFDIDFRMQDGQKGVTFCRSSMDLAGVQQAREAIDDLINYLLDGETGKQAPADPEPCTPCEPTQPECGRCEYAEEPQGTAAEFDRQLEAVADVIARQPYPKPSHDETSTGQITTGRPVKGLLYLHCGCCKACFRTFLKAPRGSYMCRCGNVIPLVSDRLAHFDYTCPACGQHNYGNTNCEDGSLEVSCVCGQEITLAWDKAHKQYQQKEV